MSSTCRQWRHHWWVIWIPDRRSGYRTIAPSSIFEKTYKSSTQMGRATNVITLLLAYIAELEEEMTGALSQGKDVTELWTEIHTVSDLILHSSRCLAQSTGRTVGLAVVGQRALWLNLSTMGEKDKTNFLDQLVDPNGLFGPAVATMQQQFEAKRREQETFRSFVPMQRQARGQAYWHGPRILTGGCSI